MCQMLFCYFEPFRTPLPLLIYYFSKKILSSSFIELIKIYYSGGDLVIMILLVRRMTEILRDDGHVNRERSCLGLVLLWSRLFMWGKWGSCYGANTIRHNSMWQSEVLIRSSWPTHHIIRTLLYTIRSTVCETTFNTLFGHLGYIGHLGHLGLLWRQGHLGHMGHLSYQFIIPMLSTLQLTN